VPVRALFYMNANSVLRVCCDLVFSLSLRKTMRYVGLLPSKMTIHGRRSWECDEFIFDDVVWTPFYSPMCFTQVPLFSSIPMVLGRLLVLCRRDLLC